jgi:hypothetical protein
MQVIIGRKKHIDKFLNIMQSLKSYEFKEMTIDELWYRWEKRREKYKNENIFENETNIRTKRKKIT